MSREKHEFQFRAATISRAAEAEAQYHRERERYWRQEQEDAGQRVMATASVSLKRQAVSGGEQLVVVVDYGDSAAYMRMQQAFAKAEHHRKAAERLETEARIYGTQDRVYELSSDDVHYFRLGGQAREE